MIALKAFEYSFTHILSDAYQLDGFEVSFIVVLSFLIILLLDPNYKKNTSSADITESDSLVITKYSFFTRFAIMFFILILIVTPIFKLLNTSYFI